MRKWHYVAITLMAILILGGFTADRWLRPYNLATERAAARAAGIPLTPADFHRPRPAPDQDAGPDWEALTAQLEKRPLDESLIKAARDVMSPGVKPSPAGDAALRRLVQSRPDVLARVHIIVQKKGAYFPHAWKPTDLFPYFAVMRKCATLIRAESALMARAGRSTDAVRNQALAFRIGDHAAQDPTLIGCLVGCAVDSITVQGLGNILDEAGPDASVARAVRTALTENPLQLNANYALMGEALSGVTTIRSITSLRGVAAVSGSGAGGRLPAPSKPGPLVRDFFLEPNEATYLHWMTRTVKAAEEPQDRREAALARVAADMETSLKGGSPSKLLATILLPTFGRAVIAELPVYARRRVLLSATSVMEYRAENGRWPAKLTDAMPEPPLDPFTGKPLSYTTDAKGFVITSTGGMNDGKPRKPITWRYPGGGL